MKITLETLVAKSACQEACDLFAAQFPDGIEREWDEVCQYLMLGDEKWRRFWVWAIANGIIPSWSMRGANLGGANLGGADLWGAYLGGAYLGGANLVGANLVGANLRGANLRGANLVGANLRGAYLSRATMPDGSVHE